MNSSLSIYLLLNLAYFFRGIIRVAFEPKLSNESSEVNQQLLIPDSHLLLGNTNGVLSAKEEHLYLHIKKCVCERGRERENRAYNGDSLQPQQ